MHPLKAYLLRRDISQHAFAAACKVSQSLISQLIRGDCEVTPERAGLIDRMTNGEVPAEAWKTAARFERDKNGAVIRYSMPIRAPSRATAAKRGKSA